MKALFADTFYWVALADTRDRSHLRALELSAEWPNTLMVTTDEVLTEYLNFFSSSPAMFRRRAAHGVEQLLTNSAVRVIPQAESPSAPA